MKSFLKMHKKRTRRVKHKHRTLKRKNVKSRKVMRGGMKEDEGIEMTEITEKTGTIVLAKFPIPRDGFELDYKLNYKLKESFRKPFFVTYEILREIPVTSQRDRESGKHHAEFAISKISETADGDNLLPQPVICYFKFPTPPSESYVLSSGHLNPIYVELGPSESKYMILEIK